MSLSASPVSFKEALLTFLFILLMAIAALSYLALPLAGIELDLSFNLCENPQLTVIDQSDGLPNFPGSQIEPRPNDRMPLLVVWPFFDSTLLVSRTFANLAEKNPPRTEIGSGATTCV